MTTAPPYLTEMNSNLPARGGARWARLLAYRTEMGDAVTAHRRDNNTSAAGPETATAGLVVEVQQPQSDRDGSSFLG
jgi:hypothetical protein